MSSLYSTNTFLSARQTPNFKNTQTFQIGGPRNSPRPYTSLSWQRPGSRKTKRPQTSQRKIGNYESRSFYLQKTPRVSSCGLLSDRQIRFEDDSDYDPGVSDVDKSTDVYFSDVFTHLDSEMESTRSRTRSEFISQISKEQMVKRLQQPSSIVHKAQSVTTASSRRSSASQSQMRERSTFIIETVRGRVLENQALHQVRSPRARLSSVASFVSVNDDYTLDIDAPMSSRSNRQIPFMVCSRSMASNSYSKQDPTFGIVKKGATEGVKPCKRMESVLNEDLGAVVNDLSRQCCDVLGPSICMECTKNMKRFNNLIIFHRKHPDIDETAMTLYAIPLIQRMYPGMGKSEIKAKLASGEIGQQMKIKINRSKDIENFDDKVTDYFPEKYRRQRMRKQRIESGAPGVIKMDNDINHVEPFNPGWSNLSESFHLAIVLEQNISNCQQICLRSLGS